MATEPSMCASGLHRIVFHSEVNSERVREVKVFINLSFAKEISYVLMLQLFLLPMHYFQTPKVS